MTTEAKPTYLTTQDLPEINYTTIRRAMRTLEEREWLEEFMKAGWTAREFAEYARVFRPPSKTRPTPLAYRLAACSGFFGPKSPVAQTYLKGFRAPGFVMPPLDRPNLPEPRPYNDPNHPDHTAQTKADVEKLARMCMARSDDWKARPRRGPETPITKQLWKQCFGTLTRSGSLERAIAYKGLQQFDERPEGA
jgi:hypothetical protein